MRLNIFAMFIGHLFFLNWPVLVICPLFYFRYSYISIDLYDFIIYHDFLLFAITFLNISPQLIPFFRGGVFFKAVVLHFYGCKFVYFISLL